jgi:hypothetical protein
VSEQEPDELPVLIPEAEVPHLSVQAGLATATGTANPQEEED